LIWLVFVFALRRFEMNMQNGMTDKPSRGEKIDAGPQRCFLEPGVVLIV
jgi:hypothetical protein